MATEKPPLLRRAVSILPGLVIAAILLLTAGIALLATKDTTVTVSHEEEYWTGCYDVSTELECYKFVFAPDDENKKCECYWQFELPEDIIGDVTMYYELGFDQSRPEYANSRDNDQLMGNPGPAPSESCGNYSYTEDGKPIFPCGEVADTMFTDVIHAPSRGEGMINITRAGILAEDMKMHYHNPPENVLTRFAEPKSWHARYWEDETNKTGTGVENEAFQAWMNTNLKRKPAWRVVSDDGVGIAKGNYSVKIDIRYFAAVFNGTRKFILEGVYPTTRMAHLVCGSIALLLGIPLFIAVVAVVIMSKRQEEASTAYNNASTLPVSDRITRSPRHLEDISEESKLNKEANGD